MNKKILIGSIIAVIILVLVSFTGVVGYQTTTSSTIAKASPLFKVRTNRAIGEESKVLTAKYVGKGTTLPFPRRDDKAIMVQKVIDRISKMDDETYEKFIVSLINLAKKDNRFNGENPDKIREAIYLLRDSDKSIPEVNVNTNNKPITAPTPSCWTPCTSKCPTFKGGLEGFLGCILLPFILIVGFFFWCFNIGSAHILCATVVNCPVTLRKLS